MLEWMKTQTGTWEQEITDAIPQAARVSIPFVGAGLAASDGLSGLGGTEDPRPLADGFSFFYVFFGMVRRRWHPKVRIRSSPLYPRSCSASSTGRGRVKSCVQWISWDLVSFHDRLCGFRSVSSDLWFSSLTMVACLVCWPFEALAWRLYVYLIQKALLR
jgi:hypothetical protein